MIPPYTHSGVLPPFMGSDPGAGAISPYPSTIVEVAQRFCHTPERVKLFRGLLAFRKELINVGFTTGVQWIDGSFTEDVESTRGRPPKDIDVVSVLIRPAAYVSDDVAWSAFVTANPKVLDPQLAKSTFNCEAFFVDGGYPALLVANQITYWSALFTHQRVSFLWKGMLQVNLQDIDDEAEKLIDKMTFPP